MDNVFTSYFAKVAKMDTSKYSLIAITRRHAPIWFQKQCDWWPLFAPSWQLLNAYNIDKIDWEDYTKRYLKEQNLPESTEEKKKLLMNKVSQKGKPIVLLCYEKEQCHRFILGRELGIKEL